MCPEALALSADMETAVETLAVGHRIAHQALHCILLRVVTDKQRRSRLAECEGEGGGMNEVMRRDADCF